MQFAQWQNANIPNGFPSKHLNQINLPSPSFIEVQLTKKIVYIDT